MIKKIDWKLCTAQELGEYLHKHRADKKDSAQWAHYKKKNNTHMLEKIELARKIAKLLLWKERVRDLECEIYGSSENTSENSSTSLGITTLQQNLVAL